MVKHNIAQALKIKNRLVGLANENHNLFTRENSREAVRFNPTLASSLYERHYQIINAICDIKATLSVAVQPVRKTIYLLGELKSLLTQIQVLPTKEGVETDRYNAANKTEYRAFLNEEKLDKVKKDLQIKINELQDELDTFNALNHMDIPQSILDLLR